MINIIIIFMGGYEGYCSKCKIHVGFMRDCANCFSLLCIKCYETLYSCNICGHNLCHRCDMNNNSCDYVRCDACNKPHDFCFNCFKYNCQCIKEKTYLHLLPKDIQNIINEMLKRT